MRTRIILLASLLVLFGCKPELPKEYAAKTVEWQLAEKNGCFMCHTVGKNLLGPAWENVAERYRNNPDAEAHLMDRIAHGSRGAWVERDMPAYPEELLSEADRKALAKFIMTM